MKNIVTGIMAHVDAGKTTLSEAFLYTTGQIRKLGRVDHKDAFLDTFSMERARGITIFSKQAMFHHGDTEITLLDTPGHVDFSAETERTLQVLDYAILVVSGSDGIQGHTSTLWSLLKEYGIPVFIFVNKMDQPDTDQDAILALLKDKLDDGCIDFTRPEGDSFYEEAAMCDEEALEAYMEDGTVSKEQLCRMICERKIFPCYFGSALKLEGVDILLDGLDRWTTEPEYPKEQGLRVYKISRDEKGQRLTHLKVTGGSLSVKQVIKGHGKADQIRLYSGQKYRLLEEAKAGTVCAVTGLTDTYAGQGIGREDTGMEPILTPLLSYRMVLPEGADVQKVLGQIRQLEEEEPALHVSWNGYLEEIHVQLMGEVQTEILKAIMQERFGLAVTFDTGHIVYKETIKNDVIGSGHYEPLRHYAHVNLILKPGKPGSGLSFSSICKEDDLDRNWQRLILTHLAEKEHIGVLTGMPITDMEIILHSGKAHQKHTEGGDFRQATYRAVRQGLKKAESVLLEPYYRFRIEVPAELIGRAMADVQKMYGEFEPPMIDGDLAILTGSAPVACMLDYQKEIISYSKGKGRMAAALKGYEPCHNQEEVVEAFGYDSEHDLDNPTGSVYCAHGAGYLVPWDEVDAKVNLKLHNENEVAAPVRRPSERSRAAEDAELLAIMEREFGKRRTEDRSGSHHGYHRKAEPMPVGDPIPERRRKSRKQYVLVDGYNVIFAWEELKGLAEQNLDAARNKLIDILSNYQGFTGCTLIAVFDAYKVENNPGEVTRHDQIYVVFTKEAETADQYIEKATHEIGKKHNVTVVTSDHLEQVIVMGQGAAKVGAQDFLKEVELVNQAIREINERKKQNQKNYLFGVLDDDLADELEQVRLGNKDFTDL